MDLMHRLLTSKTPVTYESHILCCSLLHRTVLDLVLLFFVIFLGRRLNLCPFSTTRRGGAHKGAPLVLLPIPLAKSLSRVLWHHMLPETLISSQTNNQP